jgi:hypothetical protein
MVSGRAILSGIAAAVVVAPSVARAVDPFEIQVYDGTLADPGTLGAELHANTVVAGQRTTEPPELPMHHQSHFTLEVAYVLTPVWEVGAYFQTAVLPDGSFEYAGDKLRTKFVVPVRADSPFHFGVNVELARIPEHFDRNVWGAELRPIATWSSPGGALYASINPIVDLALDGLDRNDAPSFEPAATLRYVRAQWFSIGLEYYAGLGPIGSWLPARDQEHYVYEVIDVLRWKRVELNLGVGQGLTAASNDFVAKMIVGYR